MFFLVSIYIKHHNHFGRWCVIPIKYTCIVTSQFLTFLLNQTITITITTPFPDTIAIVKGKQILQHLKVSPAEILLICIPIRSVGITVPRNLEIVAQNVTDRSSVGTRWSEWSRIIHRNLPRRKQAVAKT